MSEENYLEADLALKRIEELKEQLDLFKLQQKKEEHANTVLLCLIEIGKTARRAVPGVAGQREEQVG